MANRKLSICILNYNFHYFCALPRRELDDGAWIVIRWELMCQSRCKQMRKWDFLGETANGLAELCWTSCGLSHHSPPQRGLVQPINRSTTAIHRRSALWQWNEKFVVSGGGALESRLSIGGAPASFSYADHHREGFFSVIKVENSTRERERGESLYWSHMRSVWRFELNGSGYTHRGKGKKTRKRNEIMSRKDNTNTRDTTRGKEKRKDLNFFLKCWRLDAKTVLSPRELNFECLFCPAKQSQIKSPSKAAVKYRFMIESRSSFTLSRLANHETCLRALITRAISANTLLGREIIAQHKFVGGIEFES